MKFAWVARKWPNGSLIKFEEFGPVDQPDNRLVKRMAGEIPQALILTNDNLNVTGEYSTEFFRRRRPNGPTPGTFHH